MSSGLSNLNIVRAALNADRLKYNLLYGRDPDQVIVMTYEAYDELLHDVYKSSYLMRVTEFHTDTCDGAAVIIDKRGNIEGPFEILHRPPEEY